MNIWKKVLMWIPVIGFFFTLLWAIFSGEDLLENFSEEQVHFNGAIQGISLAITFVITIILIVI